MMEDDSTWDEKCRRVLLELKRIHAQYIEPLETKFAYDQFKPSWFAETLCITKPMVLFMGPFSAGKTTFLNYLLGVHLCAMWFARA